MTPEQQATWRYLVELAAGDALFVKLGAESREAIKAAGIELARLQREKMALQQKVDTLERQLARLKATVDCLDNGGNDA